MKILPSLPRLSSRARSSRLACQIALGTVLCAATFLTGCQSTPGSGPAGATPGGQTANGPATGQLSVANWKERLEQPYVYLENVGDYRGTHARLSELCRLAVAENLEVVGPPFTLFFDDPAMTPVRELYARVCLPIRHGATSNLAADILPRALVVYGRVAGDYRNASVGYSKLFQFMSERNWIANGPIRETYLTDPGTVGSSAELLTEIQVPWRQASVLPERAAFDRR